MPEPGGGPIGAAQLRGVYPILTEALLDPADFPAVAAELAELCSILQLRLKTLSDGARVEVHARVAERLAGWPGTLVVNDRADLAHLLARRSRAAGYAHRIGLHLGQTDLPPRAARAIVGDAVAIGLSTHTLEQLRAALDEPVDHLAFGPIFRTTTKDDPDPVVGLAQLAAAVSLVAAHPTGPRPLVAIGGIDASNARAVSDAGASAIAVVSAILRGPRAELTARARELVARVEPRGAPHD